MTAEREGREGKMRETNPLFNHRGLERALKNLVGKESVSKTERKGGVRKNYCSQELSGLRH